MKKIFVHAKSKLDVSEVIKKVKFKGRLGLVTTIQHVHKLKTAQKLLKDSIIGGQVIGCDVSKAEKVANKVDAILYIGSGRFHPVQIALKTGKNVIIADPYTNTINEIRKDDVENLKRKIKIGYIKFLHANKIGILVSIKPGQNRLKDAIKLKNKLKSMKKKGFIFVFDTLDFGQLENFPDIDSWVNTACPRIAIDDFSKFNKPVINIDDLNGKI